MLQFAARQTEQSIRLGYWMDWDDPDHAAKAGPSTSAPTKPSPSRRRRAKRCATRATRSSPGWACAEWGGSYFTFSTENNETIWAFLKKCHERGKVYSGHDVMPWSGRAGSAYSQMEVADGRRLTTHRSCFVRFPLADAAERIPARLDDDSLDAHQQRRLRGQSRAGLRAHPHERATTRSITSPRTTSTSSGSSANSKRASDAPNGVGPKATPKLKTIAQIFKEQGGFETLGDDQGGRSWSAGPTADRSTICRRRTPTAAFPTIRSSAGKTGVSCHRVIDGGRDSKGNPNVVAGEGTGIVHVAPGCGDVDYVLGKQQGLVGIAPLDEAGRFVDGFGPFTGKEATDPQTAQLVFDTLKRQAPARHRRRVSAHLSVLLADGGRAGLPPRRRVVHQHGLAGGDQGRHAPNPLAAAAASTARSASSSGSPTCATG